MGFWDKLGLLKANSINERDENGILFTLENLLLSQNKYLIPILNNRVYDMMIYPGLFAKTPYDIKDGIYRNISHDNLTSIVCLSKLLKKTWHVDIWNEIKKEGFRYNNLSPSKPGWRFLHPRDIIFYGMCNNPLWNLAFPLLAMISLVTCLNNETSGKLLLFCRCQTLKENMFMKLLYKLATFIIKKKFGSWNNVFKTYFPEENHPNNILSKEI